MRKIIFVCINMNIGGTEKALLEMLSQISLEENEVTLLMLEEYGGFLEKIPQGIQVIYLEHYEAMKGLIKRTPLESIKTYMKEKRWGKTIKLCGTYLWSKLSKDRTFFYRHLLKGYKPLEAYYDIAVAYAGPMELISYLTAYYIHAKKKIQWIHFDVTQIGLNLSFTKKVYQQFDRIFLVSRQGKEKFVKLLPALADKAEVFHNCINPSEILEQGEAGEGFLDEEDGIRLLTVGRLSKEKGQDRCIEAVARLKQEGYPVRWYAVGEGNEKENWEKLAKQLGVEKECIFLGAKTNPYTYMKQCDLYIQPSRHEGYCITLAEAKLFHHPIVTTDFTGAEEQIESEKTGLIVEGKSEALYEGIKRLLTDHHLYQEISEHLTQLEQKPAEELHKLYDVLEVPIKKKLLFMMSSFNVGGVEKSLLSLLSVLPKTQYEVTILALEKKGGFLEELPAWVKVKEVNWDEQIKQLLMGSPYENIKYYLRKKAYFKAGAFMKAYALTKWTKNRIYYLKYILKQIPSYPEKADMAIAYPGPTEIIDTYIRYKVKAKRKIGWIHFDLSQVKPNYKMYKRLYGQFDHLFVVSQEAREKVLEYLPSMRKRKAKLEVLNNMISAAHIEELAQKEMAWDEKDTAFKIVTVGRLSDEKGQDLAIKVLARLRAEGEKVRWYCIGEGKSRETYEQLIEEYGLQKDFILLGAKMNPYPYMKQADLYVQTSRHEGFCLTLAEAKCLHKAIITTRFTGAEEQVTSGVNGFIVAANEQALYEKIKYLLEHPEERQRVENKLQQEQIDTTKEVNKLLSYIEGRENDATSNKYCGPCV